MYKRSLISLCVTSALLTNFVHADDSTPTWVTENTENAEGIATPNDPKISVNLSKVIVSGVLKEDIEIAESAASIAHFGAQEVDRLNAMSLGNLLAYEPGVTVDESETGGLENIRIRGMGGDRVMISVDGAPLPTSYSFGSYLSTNRNYFDIDAMKSVDIIKGPMSTLYGGSALAGGIFMQTKDPVDFLKEGAVVGGNLKVGYRSATNAKLYSGTIAGKLTDKLSAFARLTYTQPEERENFHGRASSEALLGPDRTHPNKSDADRYNMMTKWVFEANEDNRFSLTYENFKETLNIEPLSNFGATTMATTFIDQHTKDVNKRQQLTLRHDFNFENVLFDRGFWQLYYQKNTAEQWGNETRKDRRGNLSYRTRYGSFDNKGYGFSAEFSKGVAQNDVIFHNLTYGLNYRDNKVSTFRDGDTIALKTGKSIETEAFPNMSFPDSKIKELGIFLQDRISLYDGQFEIIAGIRYDHYKLDPKTGTAFETANKGVLPPASVSEGHVSKRLALLWHPTEENTVFINYSEGFKAPSFSAVNVGFSNPMHGYTSRSNPDLKPETSKSLELGWNYVDDTKSFGLTAFYTKYNNFIEELNMVGIQPGTGYMIYQAVNLDKSHIYGFEAKAQMDLFTIQNGSGTIGFNASLAYAKGEENKTHNPINSVEPLTAMFGVEYRYLDQLYLTTRVKAVQAKKEADIYNDPNPRMPQIGRSAGYATVDVIAEYKPMRDVTINAGLYNILDKDYTTWGERMTATSPQAVNRASNPGFNAAISVTYEF